MNGNPRALNGAFLIRIRRRFHARASEWFCAANMFTFGAILLHQRPTFTSPAYVAFQRTLGEDGTGYVKTACGFMWLIDLIINGAMQATTSTIRAICASMGTVIYGMIGVGFAFAYPLTGLLSTGMGTYILLSFPALYALFHIMIDKRVNG